MSSSFLFSVFFFTIILFSSSLVAESIVPSSNTFKFTNEGEFVMYVAEYGATFRALSLYNSPFQLCFYNTTPNAFTLGLMMGDKSDSTMRWVWDANRGKPVGEKATLSFGTDGNLVLADAGKIAWQTGTANKGVVGVKILSNGNIVLYDNRGKFIWQSFDHPSDTLLVGQSLRANGPNRIVSRASNDDGSEGLYSLVLEKNRMNLYLKGKNLKKPLLYYTSDWFETGTQGPMTEALFSSAPESEEAHAYELTFQFFVAKSSAGTSILGRPKYNSTLSFLRLGYDGNLKIYTYYDKVSIGAWEVTFRMFNLRTGDGGGSGGVSQCKLPSRCGTFGVCEDEQCVACPTAKGLLGWSDSCAPPAQRKCENGKANKVDYFKVVGVEHFMSDYTEGEESLKLDACRDKCSKYCECLGYFYKEESAKCLLVPMLGTLNKVANTSHVAYIKL
ncbi:hypothetical protein MKX03_014679 [Papaver bracteatum]|nr:hypothetical protein MKX03_014679 [Papaver bracteatum]